MVPGLQQLSGIIDFAFSRDIRCLVIIFCMQDAEHWCRDHTQFPLIFNELPVTLGCTLTLIFLSVLASSRSWYRSIPLTKRFQTVRITTIEAKVVAKTG